MTKIIDYAPIIVPNKENPDEVFLRFDIPFLIEDIEDGDLDMAVAAYSDPSEGLTPSEVLVRGIQKYIAAAISHGIKRTAEAKMVEEVNALNAIRHAKAETRLIASGKHPDFDSDGNPRLKESQPALDVTLPELSE